MQILIRQSQNITFGFTLGLLTDVILVNVTLIFLMHQLFYLELGVMPELSKAMQELDWILPTDIQGEAVPQILGGGDVLMAAETGSGKTAAFCIPVIQIVYETLKDLESGKMVIDTLSFERVYRGLKYIAHRLPNKRSHVSQTNSSCFYSCCLDMASCSTPKDSIPRFFSMFDRQRTSFE